MEPMSCFTRPAPASPRTARQLQIHTTKRKKNLQNSDSEKGLGFAPILSKFNSVKKVGKKGCVPIIDYEQIEKGTENFKESNILGEGGFGCVYKASLDDNLVVAIKRLNCECQYAEREYEVI